jgi:hypothetical protein
MRLTAGSTKWTSTQKHGLPRRPIKKAVRNFLEATRAAELPDIHGISDERQLTVPEVHKQIANLEKERGSGQRLDLNTANPAD